MAEIDQTRTFFRYCTSFAELGRMDVRVSSWSELQDAVFAGSWREEINRFRSGFVFRGAPRASHSLATSLQTGGYVPHERHLLTSFRKDAPPPPRDTAAV